MSGTPAVALASPAPLMYTAGNPARSTRRAVAALKAPGIATQPFRIERRSRVVFRRDSIKLFSQSLLGCVGECIWPKPGKATALLPDQLVGFVGLHHVSRHPCSKSSASKCLCRSRTSEFTGWILPLSPVTRSWHHDQAFGR